ncbi:hypothetical protein [Hominifimenecus sp. rT4P-3]|uniref:hypothetical protein n=1 Tax=Hominifimenecus sp. rT4P-3 TaxID=3242979 RepID=UPI003DA38B0D
MAPKPKELYPFRGSMVSGYAIAKAYGLQNVAYQVQKRLRQGMTAEEAVQIKQRGPKSEIQGGIALWEIDEMRRRIYVGQKLRLMVQIYEYDGLGFDRKRYETCRVVGVYRHLVVLARPRGLKTSRTYVDLIMERGEMG